MVILSTQNTFANQTFGVHLIGQYMKVVLSTWNTLANEVLGVHSIGQ
jgi:hypothetical protein